MEIDILSQLMLRSKGNDLTSFFSYILSICAV